MHVSATVSVDLWLVTVKKTFHLDVGAQLHVWGPEFGGYADIKVKVLGIGFSFGVDFGAEAASAPPLTWTEFQTSFLPELSETVSLVPAKCLIKKVGDVWVFNPKEIELQVNSEVPVTNFGLTQNADDQSTIAGATFGVAPMHRSRCLLHFGAILRLKGATT